ncbi:unnamed protein product [Meloidogyne enterolobii]
MRISNYYVWILFESNVFEKFVKKFWANEWWNGTFLKDSEIKMEIGGDFILATPLMIKVIDNRSLNIWTIYTSIERARRAEANDNKISLIW